MENEVKGNVNIYFNGIFDYIKDKDLEISFLHSEIKRLSNKLCGKDEYIKMLDRQYNKNKNIIDELEKYLLEYSQDLEFRCYANTFLNKLKELKEGK